jgi:hypothetical protein
MLKRLVIAALTILLLGALYWGVKSTMKGGHERTGPHIRVFHLMVSNSVHESPVFVVSQGDTVTLVIRSDRAGEVHVHLYEKKVTLKPEGEVTLTFSATDAGMFPVHLHDADGTMTHLAMLEVHPQ